MNQIIEGDCLDVMKDIPDKSIDMILCDLPYGTTACSWDVVIPFDLLWEQYKRIVKDNACICLFGSQPFTTDLIMSNRKMFKYEIIWCKERGQDFINAKKRPLKAHENILIFGNKIKYNPIMEKAKRENIRKVSDLNQPSEVYGINKKASKDYDIEKRYPKSYIQYSSGRARDKEHSAQKPVKLFEYLIKTYTNENDIVLDNCAGSGTTAIACYETNRKYICIEKEKKYCNIARKRLQEKKDCYGLLHNEQMATL